MAFQPGLAKGQATTPHITTDAWFSGGQRVTYKTDTKEISENPISEKPDNPVKVYRKIVKDPAADQSAAWASFLPGWPDGSYGRASTNHQPADSGIGHRLFSTMLAMVSRTNPSIIPTARMNVPTWSKRFGGPKEYIQPSSLGLTIRP
jgi:hypothetical protein